VAVIELKAAFRETFIDFIKIYEYKSISFISRMYSDGHFFIPSSASAKVFCEISNSNPKIIKNAIMISSGGIIMPIFSEISPTPEVIIKMTENILKYNKKIFCILGVTKDNEAIKKTLKYSVYSSINYLLLKENRKNKFPIKKSSLKIKRAKKRDAALLFPLEKNYLLEEVLTKNSIINQDAALINLRKTCMKQSVFFAVSENEIVAKVNTNGKGFGYDQIGGVYTKPEYRNQGISTHLMKILLNDIQKSGKKAVLYVKKENKPALILYKNLGFEIVSNYSADYIKY
jgi:uncharacterized protein